MSSISFSGIADFRPASYAIVRAAEGDRTAVNAAARQERAIAQQRISEALAQARAADAAKSQAAAAHQQASLIQAATGSGLNVYA